MNSFRHRPGVTHCQNQPDCSSRGNYGLGGSHGLRLLINSCETVGIILSSGPFVRAPQHRTLEPVVARHALAAQSSVGPMAATARLARLSAHLQRAESSHLCGHGAALPRAAAAAGAGMVVSLEGKVAIITGAASGIGFAATQLFLEAGAAGVVAVDLSPELDANLAGVKEQWGAQLTTVTGSVSEDGTWEAAVGAAVASFGRIDVVVSIAGLGIFKPVHEHTEAEWDNVLGANVKALFYASRHAIPVMKEQQSGLFLNTGSISSVVGMSAQGAYAASKGAVSQLTRQMAKDYAADGIRSNAVCPGSVATAVLDKYLSDQAEGDPEGRDTDYFLDEISSSHPVGRIANAEEVARFYVYMASDFASFFNGANLMIDGGYSSTA